MLSTILTCSTCLNQNSNERTLLSVTTEVLFNDEFRVDVLTCATTGRQYWEGSAKEWSHALLSSKDISHQRQGDCGRECWRSATQHRRLDARLRTWQPSPMAGSSSKDTPKRGNMWKMCGTIMHSKLTMKMSHFRGDKVVNRRFALFTSVSTQSQ